MDHNKEIEVKSYSRVTNKKVYTEIDVGILVIRWEQAKVAKL